MGPLVLAVEKLRRSSEVAKASEGNARA
jgi:hypothetical protein